jgi:hypothetical protein
VHVFFPCEDHGYGSLLRAGRQTRRMERRACIHDVTSASVFIPNECVAGIAIRSGCILLRMVVDRVGNE